MEATLPLVFCRGFPKSLHQLNEAELERFLVYVWNFTGTPDHAQVLPDGKCHDRPYFLRQLICSFYERLGLSYLLYFSEGLAKTKGSNIYYEIDSANKNIVVWNKRSKSVIAKIPASNVCYDSFAGKIAVPKIKAPKSPSKKKNIGEGRFPVIDKVWSNAAIVHVELIDIDDEKPPNNEEKEIKKEDRISLQFIKKEIDLQVLLNEAPFSCSGNLRIKLVHLRSKEVFQESIVISDSEEPVPNKQEQARKKSEESQISRKERLDIAVSLSNVKEQGSKRLEEARRRSREGLPLRLSDVAVMLSNGTEQGRKIIKESCRKRKEVLQQRQSDVTVRLSNRKEQASRTLEELKRSTEWLLQRQSDVAVRLCSRKFDPEVPFISESVSVTKLEKSDQSVPFISESISVTKINLIAQKRDVDKNSLSDNRRPGSHLVSEVNNDEIVISDSEEPSPCRTPSHRKASDPPEEILISDSEDSNDTENKRNYLYRLELCDSTNEPDDPIILPVPGKGDFNKFHRLPLMMVPLLVKHSLIDKNCINPGPPGQNISSLATDCKSVSESVKRSKRAKVKHGRYRTLNLDSCRDYHFPKKHYRGVLCAPLPLKKKNLRVPQKNKKNTQKKSNQGNVICKIYNPVVRVKKLDEHIYLEHLKKCL